jgi:hypothetical protein
MIKVPGLLSGKALAARFGVYIGQSGTPCTIYSFVPPVIGAKGMPGVSTFAVHSSPLTVLFQFGKEADDMATMLGVVDEQVAIGFIAASDDGRVKDRDFLKDDRGQVWLVRDIPDAQPMGGIVGVKLTLVRTTRPPVGVV